MVGGGAGEFNRSDNGQAGADGGRLAVGTSDVPLRLTLLNWKLKGVAQLKRGSVALAYHKVGSAPVRSTLKATAMQASLLNSKAC